MLAIVGGAIALFCLGGATVAYVLYDHATAPDRSAPDVVVDNYLRSFVVDHNDAKAGQYTCDKPEQLADLAALRADLLAREKQYNLTFVVKWGPLSQTRNGDGATVQTTLNIAGIVDGQQRSGHNETWAFDVVDQDGWRVCGAHKVG